MPILEFIGLAHNVAHTLFDQTKSWMEPAPTTLVMLWATDPPWTLGTFPAPFSLNLYHILLTCYANENYKCVMYCNMWNVLCTNFESIDVLCTRSKSRNVLCTRSRSKNVLYTRSRSIDVLCTISKSRNILCTRSRSINVLCNAINGSNLVSAHNYFIQIVLIIKWFFS